VSIFKRLRARGTDQKHSVVVHGLLKNYELFVLIDHSLRIIIIHKTGLLKTQACKIKVMKVVCIILADYTGI
jgi:hypothetical protein